MTKEEAIEWIEGLRDGWDDTTNITACNMAIKALEQEPCNDAISRQAVLERREILKDKQGTGYQAIKTKYIRELPSVTPQPKTGRWITQYNVAHQKEYYYCSECREEFSFDGETGIKMNDYNYCPNCGCRMFEPQESEG